MKISELLEHKKFYELNFYESEEESYAGAYSEILALFIFEYCGRISDEF